MYPIMQLSPKKEKRMQTETANGKVVVREIDVEVHESRQRQFLFAGKEALVSR
jgi:hypothetical protein